MFLDVDNVLQKVAFCNSPALQHLFSDHTLLDLLLQNLEVLERALVFTFGVFVSAFQKLCCDCC